MNSVGFLGSSNGKESAYIVGDLGSIVGLGRSPGERNGNPLQCSSLEIPWTEEPDIKISFSLAISVIPFLVI